MSACCRELHVMDVILCGWCTWSEKSGVKAEGHLAVCFDLLGGAPRERTFSHSFVMSFPPRSASRTIVFLVRLLDTVPRGPQNNWVNICQLLELK